MPSLFSVFLHTVARVPKERMTYMLLVLSCTLLRSAALTVGLCEVCGNKSCRKLKSDKTLRMFKDLVQPYDLEVQSVGCIGNCGAGPNVRCGATVYPGVVSPATVAAICSIEHGVEIPDSVIESYESFVSGLALKKGAAVLKFTEALFCDDLADFPKARASYLLARSEANLDVSKKSLAAQKDALLACRTDPKSARVWWALRDTLKSAGKPYSALTALLGLVMNVRDAPARKAAISDAEKLCRKSNKLDHPMCLLVKEFTS